MLCPNCDKDYDRGQSECPHCGIIFEKWRAKQAREAQPAPAPAVSAKPAGGGFPIGALLLAGLVAGGGFWCWKRYNAAPPPEIPEAQRPAGKKAPASAPKGPSVGEQLAAQEADRQLEALLGELNNEAAVHQAAFSRNDIMAVYNEAAKVPYPGKYFGYAKDLGLSPAPNEPVDAAEKQKEREGKKTFEAKCLVNGMWEYPGAPKPKTDAVQQCYKRVRSTQQNGFIMIGGNGFVTPWWKPLVWQPHYERWGTFDESTLARLIEAHVQTKMGFEAEAKDREASQKQLADPKCLDSPDCVKRALLTAFQTRIARVGLEYQVSLLRSPL